MRAGEPDHPESGATAARQKQKCRHLRVSEQHQGKQHQPTDQSHQNGRCLNLSLLFL